MSGRFWRTPIALGAIAAFALFIHAPPARASTIQPIFASVSGPVAGVYTYTYNLQLTPNNGLVGTSPTLNNESGLVIFDFPALSASVQSSAGVTLTTDWAPAEVITNTGAGTLPNWTFAAGSTTINGFAGGGTSVDSSTVTNVMVKYTGGGLTNVGLTNLNLINLVITSTAAPGFGPLQSLSRNTATQGAIPNEVDSFPVVTAAAPLPATANMGLALLAGLVGIGGVRRVCNRRATAA